jgi:hypothetical protein
MKMNGKQLETALVLIERLYKAGRITQKQYWEIEGGIVDVFNGDGTGFLDDLETLPRNLGYRILETIGFFPRLGASIIKSGFPA